MVTLDPANLIPGSIAHFWNKVAENATLSPSFLEKKQVVMPSTARTFCEAAVESKMKRMLKGETHEGAFVKTGEGDDAIDTSELATLNAEDRNGQAEMVAQISYHIEEMLSMHVSKILERQKATAEHHGSASGGSGPGKIPAGMVPPQAKRVLNPPAPLHDLSYASLNGNPSKKTKAGPETDQDDSFKSIRAKQADKHLAVASDFNSLAEKLIASCQSSEDTEDSKIRVAQASATATSQAWTSALDAIVTKGVQAWRAPVEVRSKQGHLVNISAKSLYNRICEIGDVFRKNSALQNALVANGMDGAMLSFLSDENILKFFITSCNLTELQAAMVLAKIKSWD